MLVTVLGANGPTGRLLSKGLVYAGHQVRALTRHPDDGGLSGLDITVIKGDATREDDLRRAFRGAEAVVSVLGTPYSKDPISLHSESATAVTSYLLANGPRRLVVTSSAVLSSWRDPGMDWFERTVLLPLVESMGRTLYEDMRRMEAIVSSTDLDWTIMRPLGLADMDATTRWAVAEDHIAGRQTARRDLAAAIIDQLRRTDFIRTTAAVATTNQSVSVPVTIWREAIRPKLPWTRPR
jgi:putative NADH-flavin reductase